jgi:hypothetical protein
LNKKSKTRWIARLPLPAGLGEPVSLVFSRRGHLLASLLVMLLLLELTLRVVSPEIAWTQREDPWLGWSSREYQEFNPAANTGAGKRILFLGDSYLAGSRLSSLDHRFPVLMGQHLGTTGTIRILASGGWGPDQELLAYQVKGAAWRPDIVVMAFCANNDISDIMSHQHGPRMRKPYFEYSKASGLKLHAFDGREIAPIDREQQNFRFANFPLWKRSLALRFIVLRARGQLTTEKYDPEAFPLVDARYKQFRYWEEKSEELYEKRERLSWSPQKGISHVSAYIEEDFEQNTFQWELFEQVMARLHQEVKRSRAQLVLMMMPAIYNPRDLDTIAGGPFRHQFQTPDGAFTFRSAAPRDRLRQICARQEIDFFDPTDEFRAYVVQHSLLEQVWPWAGDRHFSDLGHEILARISMKWLAGFLKSPDGTAGP